MAEYDKPLVHGITAAGDKKPILVNADGSLIGGGGGGGSGDASAANQQTQISRLTEVRDRLPASLGAKPTNESLSVAIANNQPGVLVKNTAKKFRDDFAGTSLSGNWILVQTGAGQSVSVANSELIISSGTTTNSETIIRSVQTYTMPFKAQWIAFFSNRVSNNECYLEIVDASGQHYARWGFDNNSTTGSSAKIQTANEGNSIGTANPGTGNGLAGALTAYQVFEIDLSIDSIDFFTKNTDSSTGRGIPFCRTRQIPDPNLEYFIQIRCKNLATAPTSSINFEIDSVSVHDIEEISAEITGGRGGGANLAIPIVGAVSVNAGAIVRVTSNTSSFTETTTPLAANATFTGVSRDSQNNGNSGAGSAMDTVITAIRTDQPLTATIEESTDNVNWEPLNPSQTIPIGATKFTTRLVLRYYRLKITAGATAPTLLKAWTTASGMS